MADRDGFRIGLCPHTSSGYELMRAGASHNSSPVLALLADLFLLFVIVGCYLVDVFQAVYLFDAGERFHIGI